MLQPVTVDETALLAREWELSAVHRTVTGRDMPLATNTDPAWMLVLAGSAQVRLGGIDTPAAGEQAVDARDSRVDPLVLASGDAVLIAAGPRLVVAEAASDIVTADLRPALPLPGVPRALVVRDFAGRNVALRQLVETCPLGGRECSSALWTRAYANVLGAAMLTSWLAERSSTGASDPAVAAVLDALMVAPGEAWTLDRMARIAHLSRSALTARFQASMGKPPSDVLRELRMSEARELLASRNPIGAVAFAVGYGSTAAFSRAFSSHHGVAPQAWRDAHARA